MSKAVYSKKKTEHFKYVYNGRHHETVSLTISRMVS